MIFYLFFNVVAVVVVVAYRCSHSDALRNSVTKDMPLDDLRSVPYDNETEFIAKHNRKRALAPIRIKLDFSFFDATALDCRSAGFCLFVFLIF